MFEGYRGQGWSKPERPKLMSRTELRRHYKETTENLAAQKDQELVLAALELRYGCPIEQERAKETLALEPHLEEIVRVAAAERICRAMVEEGKEVSEAMVIRVLKMMNEAEEPPMFSDD